MVRERSDGGSGPDGDWDVTSNTENGRRAAPASGTGGGGTSRDRQFLGDTIAYSASRILPAVVGLVLLLVATRLLGPDELGHYGLITYVVIFLASLGGGWTEQTAIRFYPMYENRGDTETFFRHHAATVAVTAAAFVGLGLVTYIVLGDRFGPYRSHLPLAIVILGASLLYHNAQYLLTARCESWTYSITEAMRALVVLGSGLGLLFLWRADVTALLVALLLSLVVPLPFALKRAGLLRIPIPSPGWGAYVWSALLYGFPMAGWIFGTVFFATTIRFTLQFFQGSTGVGIFHANYQVLPELVSIALLPVLFAARPILMRAGEESGPDEAEAAMTRFTRYFLLFAVPLGVAVSIGARDATRVLLGEEFHGGWVIVPWLVLGIIGWNLGVFGNARFEIQRKTGAVLRVLGICAAMNLILAIVLVPRLGLTGAAVATCVTFWCYPILMGVHPGSPIRWRVPWASAGRIVASGAVGAAAGAVFLGFVPEWGPFLRATFSGSIVVVMFVAFLVAIGEIGAGEIRQLKDAMIPGFLKRSGAEGG